MDNNIDELAKEAGISIVKLAKESGYSRGYINLLKAGKKRINQEVLERLAKPLGCRPEDIITKKITVSGTIGAEGEITFLNDAQKAASEDRVSVPPELNPAEVVAARIKGDPLFPVFQDGWVLY